MCKHYCTSSYTLPWPSSHLISWQPRNHSPRLIHSRNPRTQGIKAGASSFQYQPELHSEFKAIYSETLSQKDFNRDPHRFFLDPYKEAVMCHIMDDVSANGRLPGSQGPIWVYHPKMDFLNNTFLECIPLAKWQMDIYAKVYRFVWSNIYCHTVLVNFLSLGQNT